MSIKQLKTEFIGRGSVKGFNFKQVLKSEKAYMYEVNGKYYKVFERKIHRRFEQEIYPKDEHFGNWAWCFSSNDKESDYNNALKAFNKLNK